MQGDIDDAKIRAQIDAMVLKRPVRDCSRTENDTCATKSMSLQELGYVHAGVDDGWQSCDSFHVMPSNTSVFHDADGRPIVNKTRFPDLKGLSLYADTKNILLGWYNNNCICHESGGRIGHSNDTWVNLSYIGDVEQLVANNFKGIKVDNCGKLVVSYLGEPVSSAAICLTKALLVCIGLHNNMDHYAELMNQTGQAFLVERSDQGHGTPTNLSWCPCKVFASSATVHHHYTVGISLCRIMVAYAHSNSVLGARPALWSSMAE